MEHFQKSALLANKPLRLCKPDKYLCVCRHILSLKSHDLTCVDLCREHSNYLSQGNHRLVKGLIYELGGDCLRLDLKRKREIALKSSPHKSFQSACENI